MYLHGSATAKSWEEVRKMALLTSGIGASTLHEGWQYSW
jgi:hypothetical protein